MAFAQRTGRKSLRDTEVTVGANANKLYIDTDLVGLDLKTAVYALDTTTNDLCLSLFESASFRKARAAVKLRTFLDLLVAMPAFIHISDGKMREVNAPDLLPTDPGAFYVVDRAYLDFERLCATNLTGTLFLTLSKTNMNAKRVYPQRTDQSTAPSAINR